MKKILNVIILLVGAALLFSCAPTGTPSDHPDGYKLRGVVLEIGNNHVDIRITEAENATGTYRVLISDSTKIYDKDGKSATKAAIKTGDSIEVTYNGQVMRSLPPQVAAIKISIY